MSLLHVTDTVLSTAYLLIYGNYVQYDNWKESNSWYRPVLELTYQTVFISFIFMRADFYGLFSLRGNANSCIVLIVFGQKYAEVDFVFSLLIIKNSPSLLVLILSHRSSHTN